MTYTGKVQNGVVVLDNGAALADGTPVRVEPVESADSGSDTGIFSAGHRAVATGQPDLATNLDHHLYGHPKSNDERK